MSAPERRPTLVNKYADTYRIPKNSVCVCGLLSRRLHRGGLPPFFLSEEDPEREFQDRPPLAVECKWSADQFDSRGLQAFRRLYPEGPNFVVCRDVDRSYKRNFGNLEMEFVGLDELIARLEKD